MQRPFETYFGGKGSSGTYQRIINHIRPHQRLVEVFAGNATITSKIKKSQQNVLVELNPDVAQALSITMNEVEVRTGNGLDFLRAELANPSE